MNNFEIVGVDTDTFFIYVVVHIYAGKNDHDTSLNALMMKSVEKMVYYMETEGFLPPKKIWTIRTGILIHPSKNK